MGCSPPSEWYEAQSKAEFESRRRKHKERVYQLIIDIEEMDEIQKRRLRNALSLDKPDIYG